MSSEALVPYSPGAIEAKEEALVQQFRKWEKRGRGWMVYDFPVEIEPPFEPFVLVEPPTPPPVDDGRVQGLLSRILAGRLDTAAASSHPYRERMREYDEWLKEEIEPDLCSHYNETFREIRVLLPEGMRPSKPAIEQFLTSLAFASHPISFEVIGTPEEVVIQFCATDRDLKQLRQQFAAHLPETALIESVGHLENTWINGAHSSVLVDFGLSEEFFLPLNVVSNLEIDPLIGVVGAMSDLDGDEIGILQVLFKQVPGHWSAETIDTVQSLDEIGYFTYRPNARSLCREKVRSPLLAVVLRVAARSMDRSAALRVVRNIAGALAQLSRPDANELIPLSNEAYDDDHHQQAFLDRQSFRCGMLLNREELVSLVHPPASTVRSAKFLRRSTETRQAPAITQGNSLRLGINEHQGESFEVSVSNDQRTRHTHLIGSSGSGKSTLMLSLIKQDLDSGSGLCVMDPHGDLIDSVLKNIPEGRVKDVVLFDPSDAEYPVGFNILKASSPLEKAILSSDLIATFRRMSTSWGDVMDSVLANAILAFVESTRGGTLFELKRFLVEKPFSTEFLETVTDEAVRYFWENEFELLSGKPQSSILIRLDAFLRQGLIRNVVCQKENKLDFRRIMDDRKILLIKLSQGLIGEENARLLGTMLVSRIYQSAITRQDSPDRPFFWLYLDEFHHFITPSMERILSGTRKYNLGLILAHQEFRQMQTRSQEVASSVLANCYTRICFRLGDADAEKFASGFSGFDAKALQNLGIGEAIARVERADYDFNMRVTPVPAISNEVAKDRTDRVREHSRRLFARVRSDVEAEISAARPPREKAKGTVSKDDARSNPEKFAKTPVIDPEKQGDGPADHNAEGASEHRYLQNLIKRIGEDSGFVSTIEEPVFGGVGRIDVALERDGSRIACEIAVSNTNEYEIQNIQKCLAAGFDKVVVVSTDRRRLKSISVRAELILTPDHLSRVHFLEPENFHLLLAGLKEKGPTADEVEERIKGYKVEASIRETPKNENESKRKVIMEILSRAIRRNKNPENE